MQIKEAVGVENLGVLLSVCASHLKQGYAKANTNSI
jgi:hypothetical protein